jgi:hypothetical protein
MGNDSSKIETYDDQEPSQADFQDPGRRRLNVHEREYSDDYQRDHVESADGWQMDPDARSSVAGSQKMSNYSESGFDRQKFQMEDAIHAAFQEAEEHTPEPQAQNFPQSDVQAPLIHAEQRAKANQAAERARDRHILERVVVPNVRGVDYTLRKKNALAQVSLVQARVPK